MFHRLAVVCLLPLICQGQDESPDRIFQQSLRWFQTGEYLLARDGFARAWKQLEAARGPLDPDAIDARIFYGQILTMTGEAMDAMTVLGPVSNGDSRKAKIARASFALALRQAGQFSRAIGILTALVRSFPPSSPEDLIHLGRMHSELAVCLAYSRHFREAETHAREARRLLDASGQPPMPHHASVDTILGQIFLLSNRDAEAYAMLSKAREEARPFWNENHPELAILEGALGLLAFRMGRYGEAERRTRASLASMEKLLGPGHPEVGAISHQLSLVLKKQKRGDESREWAARSRSILERARVAPKVSAWSWREVK